MCSFLPCVISGMALDRPPSSSVNFFFFFVKMTGHTHWAYENSSVKFQHYILLLHCSLLHILIIFLNTFLTLVCLKLESCLNV